MGLIRNLKNTIKGHYGEAKLERSLDTLDFFGYDGYCLRNVYVPRKDTKSLGYVEMNKVA